MFSMMAKLEAHHGLAVQVVASCICGQTGGSLADKYQIVMVPCSRYWTQLAGDTPVNKHYAASDVFSYLLVSRRRTLRNTRHLC